MTRKIKKISEMLEYFHCMNDNTAEAWPYCSKRSDDGMLQVWFICSTFVLSEHGIKMTALLEVSTKDKQHAVVHFFCLKEWNRQRSISNWLPGMDRTVCYSEVCISGSKCLKTAEPVLLMQTGKNAHPHPQTKKTWNVLKQ
jgi:hypothetical protein